MEDRRFRRLLRQAAESTDTRSTIRLVRDMQRMLQSWEARLLLEAREHGLTWHDLEPAADARPYSARRATCCTD